MQKKLKLVRIDSNYCDYLRKYDEKVPYNFNKKEIRPFVGILFTVNKCSYFAPLSSPKAKHLKMRNTIDFLRLDNGKLGAINFNNMVPVTDKNIIYLNLEEEKNTNSEKKYQLLLINQIYWLNRNSGKIYKQSKNLYFKYSNGELSETISKRCCNFKLLEKKCDEFNK